MREFWAYKWFRAARSFEKFSEKNKVNINVILEKADASQEMYVLTGDYDYLSRFVGNIKKAIRLSSEEAAKLIFETISTEIERRLSLNMSHYERIRREEIQKVYGLMREGQVLKVAEIYFHASIAFRKSLQVAQEDGLPSDNVIVLISEFIHSELKRLGKGMTRMQRRESHSDLCLAFMERFQITGNKDDLERAYKHHSKVLLIPITKESCR